MVLTPYIYGPRQTPHIKTNILNSYTNTFCILNRAGLNKIFFNEIDVERGCSVAFLNQLSK